MICKVSHVTITILSFAFNMSVMALYRESILLTLSTSNVTHYNDTLKFIITRIKKIVISLSERHRIASLISRNKSSMSHVGSHTGIR